MSIKFVEKKIIPGQLHTLRAPKRHSEALNGGTSHLEAVNLAACKAFLIPAEIWGEIGE